MEEKKKASTVKKTGTAKKSTTKKVNSNKDTKKESKKAPAKNIKAEKVNVTKEVVTKVEKEKEKGKIAKWFSNLTLDQIVLGGIALIALLLIILIIVASRNTKLPDGDEVVLKVNGKKVTANELYTKLKSQNGRSVAIDMIDSYIIDKEYKTTDEMKNSAKSTIDNYKNTYGDSYESFLAYNGISNDAELKDILIKNSKLTKATEAYVKDNITDAEMKKYYDDSIKGDIKASHILIKFSYNDDATEEEKNANKEETKKKAQELIDRIKNGEDFATLAKEYSEDEGSKSSGGDLGFFNTGSMEENFEKAAYNLDVNEYTKEPVETSYGYHVILKTDEKEKPSYDTSKDIIIDKLINEKMTNDSTVSLKAMANLRKKYNLKIYDKTIKNDYNTYMKEATKSNNQNS